MTGGEKRFKADFLPHLHLLEITNNPQQLFHETGLSAGLFTINTNNNRTFFEQKTVEN